MLFRSPDTDVCYEEIKETEPNVRRNPKPKRALALLSNDSLDIEEHKKKLSEQIKTNEDGSVSCKICGKTSPPNQRNMKQNMRNHVEIHFEGLSYPCQSCDKTFRQERNLYTHMKIHKI